MQASEKKRIENILLAEEMANIMEPYYEGKKLLAFFKGRAETILIGEKEAEEYAKQHGFDLGNGGYKYGSREYLDNVVAKEVAESLRQLLDANDQENFVFDDEYYQKTESFFGNISPDYFKGLLSRGIITQNQIDRYNELLGERDLYIKKHFIEWTIESLKGNGKFFIDYNRNFFFDLWKDLEHKRTGIEIYRSKAYSGTETKLVWRVGDHSLVMIGHSRDYDNAGGIPSAIEVKENSLTEDEIKLMLNEIYR